jgi:ATP-dependent DNA ligase
MTLYQFTKLLQSTSSSKEKLAIMEANKDNEHFQNYLTAVTAPAINFFLTKLPTVDKVGEREFSDNDIVLALRDISTRKVSGNAAKAYIKQGLETLNAEGQELLSMLLLKDIKANVGETLVLKVWPDAFFVPSYMRCSLLDNKIEAAFSKEKEFFVQLKSDGQYVQFGKTPTGDCFAFTRNGTAWPKEYAEKLASTLPDGVVLCGEAVIFENCALLSRKIGNGILNKLLKSGEIDDKYDIYIQAWDYLTFQEWHEGSSDVHYVVRLGRLNKLVESVPTRPYSVIQTQVVSSMEEAKAFYALKLSEGAEGAVIKMFSLPYKDHTSPKQVKLKIQFTCDMKIVGIYEGEGKAKGMLGGFELESSCSKVKCRVGSGFTDADRKVLFNDGVVGKIVEVEANDVIDSEGKTTYSLFLPVFVELRTDKSEADSYERIMQQLNSAKGL